MVSALNSNFKFAGLSLAKRMGCEGVFVRMIGAGTVAEKDGRLRVGDRILKVRYLWASRREIQNYRWTEKELASSRPHASSRS